MKPLPRIQPLGRVRLNFVKVYAPSQGVVLKAHRENGDNPELYLDLEYPRPEFEQQNGPELHLGFSGNFRVEPLRSSNVKPHLDAYIDISEIGSFLQALVRANLFQAPCHNAKPADQSSRRLDPVRQPLALAGGRVKLSGETAGRGRATCQGDGLTSASFQASCARPTARHQREGVRDDD